MSGKKIRSLQILAKKVLDQRVLDQKAFGLITRILDLKDKIRVRSYHYGLK
jgi:hypothetical protein